MTTAVRIRPDVTDADPVRAHIRTLYTANFTDFRIALLAGTSPATVHAVGQRPYAKDRGRQHLIGTALAERILAVTPATAQPGRPPIAGSQRRIHALMTYGWAQPYLAEQGPVSRKSIDRISRAANPSATVTVTTATNIAALYVRLRSQTPEHHGVPVGIARRLRGYAKRRGWAPPAYWDSPDHPIDDPDFRCGYGIPAAQLIAEEARWLMTIGGLTQAETAGRLKRSHRYIAEALRDYPVDDEQAAA